MRKAVLIIMLHLLSLLGFGQDVKIGDILCTDGSTVSREAFPGSGKTAEGVVFYVDNSGQQGWAVNLHIDAYDIDWVDEIHYYDGFDIPDLPNSEYSRDNLFDLNGYQNTAIIRAAYGPDWFPAAWSVDFDHGWYLPAAGQLRWLVAYANEVNESLAIVNGTPLTHERPNWHWSSTEQDAMHAIVVSENGSTANYMKWNYYHTVTIGVRSIRDFNIAKRDSHFIGEVVVTAGGQKGVVFYVSPEDDSYWLVALNDLPQKYSWGDSQDIDEIDNHAIYDYELHGVHCGYDATEAMRSAQGVNTTYAASHVNFSDGWHIPSAGQLSKLFAALPHIEEALVQNGGLSPSDDYYWSSTERDGQSAWTVNFGGNLYQEGAFRADEKTMLHFVRPVWSEPCNVSPPPPVPTFPDNIIETGCNRPIEGNPWDIQLLYSSLDNNVASYSPIVVGDIDGNGVTDIIVAKYDGNNYRSCEIDVYSGLDLSLQHSFTVPDTIYLSNGPYVIGRYPKPDGSMQGAIFTHCYDKRIRTYAIDGTLLNVSDRPTSFDGMVSLADFNGDGYPEVYSGSDIFDAATLKWLCSGPTDGNKGLSYRGTPAYSNGTYHHTYYAMSLAYNALGNAAQELICGNTIYNVNIVSRTNPSLNSITVNKIVTPPNGCSQDGHVCLADFDLDGETEILVIRDDTNDQIVDNTYFYAYKPSNGQIVFQKAYQCASTSYVFIGNIDGDPHPEIIFLENQPNGYYEEIICWRYTTQEGLNTLWTQGHDDRSGMTAMTLFDFNQDNIMELVYRDNNHLRIINASGKSHITGNDTICPYNIYTRMMAAGTGIEYPVVADVNGDGSAEIVVTGLLDDYAYYDIGYGGLHVFGSPQSWGSARKVWNQYMYHVTNVNEDLTIPTFCFNTATVFTGTDGTIRRPYNNFLQQAGYINQYGEPIGEDGEPQYVDIYGILHGEYIWNGTTYTAPGDYTQQFIDVYGCDSIVTLHLSIDLTDMPDNILDSDCNNNTPIPFEGGQLLYQTSSNVNTYATPLCGDIDGDGINDIVVAQYTAVDEDYRIWSNKLGIYNGNDLTLQNTISVPQEVYLTYTPLGIVRYPLDNGEMQGAIIALCNDGKLRSYTKSGQLLHTADIDPPCDGSPAFADFNNDGYPEIYIGNAIYDAATLKWLCSGPENGNKGLSFRGSPNTAFPHHSNYALPYAYNVFGDEKLELICGNTIYDVNIASRANPALNSVTENKTITPPNGFPQDGQVSIADLDLDGQVEILVVKDPTDDCVDDYSYLYAYRPSNGAILFQYSIYCRGLGYPVICNIDNEPHPEIVFVDYQRNVSTKRMHCFRYRNGLETVWELPHDDPSGMTTMAFFDFDKDEIPEIVYRDAYAINIIKGNGDVLYSYPMRSGTSGEHPIVADVNNDGHAEIIATGLLDDYYGNNGFGSLTMFGAPDWPSARQVWNQYAYNVTNVNNDLTIPRFGFDNATVFNAPDGSKRRPYNNFLYQATYLTSTGEPYNPSGYVEAEHYGEGCETYIYHGITYAESGDYEYLIENPLGCDTLLTVHVLIGDTIHAIQYKSVCTPYTWNGITYDETGIYQQTFTSAQGCDSVVTLYLSMGQQVFNHLAVSTCDSYTWNGTTYTESGLYEQTFATAQGCDSIVILDLTIKASSPVSQIHGESLIYYQTTGTYTYSIDPVEGCFGYEWSIDGPWSISASPDSPECTVNINSPGTATLKVRVYTECGVIERSLYINHDARPNIVIYPNPTQGEFNIVLYGMEGEALIVIYDYLGQLIERYTIDTDIQGTVVPYSLAGKAAGVYLVTVVNHYNIVTKKVVKDTASSYGFYNWDW